MSCLSKTNSNDLLKFPCKSKEHPIHNKIFNKWLINPWNFISSLRILFITSYLRPSRVYRELKRPSLTRLNEKELRRKEDPLEQLTFNIKFLMSFELANYRSKNSSSVSETSKLQVAVNKLTKTPTLERKKLTKNKKTHSSEIVSHYNNTAKTQPISRKQSKIYHLRNFNNWIKNMLISEYIKQIRINKPSDASLRVLDLCCGKGGDLLKYINYKISHLICTDIAKVSLQQCQSRYRRLIKENQSCFSAEFLTCDCSQERLKKLYKSPWLEHHLVSCQFALHYSFESYSQANCMINNASESLQAGGFLIATIPNANEIMRRLRKSHDGKSFGNEFYNIRFLCDSKRPPIFGAKYLFQLEGVVDCAEFLVHFPTLVKLCRKHGLKLEKVNTFAEYFKASFEKGANLLEKTKGLQTVYYERGSKLENNFEHIGNLANETENFSDTYGTLSKPEWEVATLYLVCAFKKCPNTWDSEMSPVYDFDC